jgi:hypothetical protein
VPVIESHAGCFVRGGPLHQRTKVPPDVTASTSARSACPFFHLLQSASFADLETKLQRAKKSRRIADIDARCCNVLGNDSSGPDYDPVANIDGENGYIRADTDIIADPGRTPKILSSLGGAARRKEIVDEHGAMGDETIVPDRHELADECVGLHSAPIANDDAALDFDKGPNEAIVSNFAAVEVYRFGDCYSAAESNINDAGLPNRGFCHSVFRG